MLDRILDPASSIREVAPGLFSCLDATDEGAPYDAFAAAYDRAVSNGVYLKLAWGISRADNARFVRAAFESDTEGWLVDIAAGSCVDSAEAYATTRRPTIVLDRSLAMLRRGMERLTALGGAAPRHVYFVQADASALPIRSDSVSTVLCHGAYHVFPETAKIVSEWRRVLADRGSLFVSSLVRGRWLGDRYLAALHRAGEVARPKSASEFAAALETECGRPVRCDAIGSFAYARSAST